jgi:hypothetical protein
MSGLKILRHTLQGWSGVTQGRPLSAKLFNILVDAVVREWFWQLQESGEYEEDELVKMMAAFFAIFYVNDAYLASWDAGFLQHALDILVDLFGRSSDEHV